MIVKIIKLPFKAVATVLAVALMALHFVDAIVVLFFIFSLVLASFPLGGFRFLPLISGSLDIDLREMKEDVRMLEVVKREYIKNGKEKSKYDGAR